MKYTLLSLGLLALCLVFCLFSMQTVTVTCERTSDALQASLSAVQKQALSQAEDALSEAETLWQEKAAFFGIVLRHEQIDEIVTGFAELHQYAQIGDLDDYQATCARLLTALGHLADMEKPTLENIL